jgi:hypothetical protein
MKFDSTKVLLELYPAARRGLAVEEYLSPSSSQYGNEK